MVKSFGGRGYAPDHTESLHRPIMTSGAGCPLFNNLTINYTKLKQNVTTKNNVMMCNVAHGFKVSSS